jgi:hypothetical protein
VYFLQFKILNIVSIRPWIQTLVLPTRNKILLYMINIIRQAWWYTPRILALGILRWDWKFKVSLSYIARPCLKKIFTKLYECNKLICILPQGMVWIFCPIQTLSARAPYHYHQSQDVTHWKKARLEAQREPTNLSLNPSSGLARRMTINKSFNQSDPWFSHLLNGLPMPP